MGIYMWAYREANFYNWDGDFWFVLRCFTIIDFFLTSFGLFVLSRCQMKNLPLNKSSMKLNRVFFLMLMLSEYVGIYLFTAGFKIIPMLSSDVDDARFELGGMARPGAGIGMLLVNLGVLCVIHLYFSKMSKILKALLFFVIYIPFLLYGGRFLMIMPILLLMIIILIQKVDQIRWANIVKYGIGVGFAFFLLMYYGAYRKNGSDMETEFLLDFITGDLFPEFRGAIGSYSLNKKDLSIDFFYFLMANFIPGFVATPLGIDKSKQLSIGSYIADLLGFDGLFGIRISFTGELLLTNMFVLLLFWCLLITIVLKINQLYFRIEQWNFSKMILLYIGISIGPIIPYGITHIPGTLLLMISLLIIYCLSFPKMSNK